MLAVEGEGFVAEEALEDDGRLLEPVDPHRRRVEPDAGVLVLLAQPPGAEADLQPALGQDVEGGEFLGQDRRLAEVLRQHGLGDPQGRRGVGHGLTGDQGSEGADEVIGEPERRVAEGLDRAGGIEQLLPLRRGAAGEAEADGSSGGHRVLHLMCGDRRAPPSRRITSPLR